MSHFRIGDSSNLCLASSISYLLFHRVPFALHSKGGISNSPFMCLITTWIKLLTAAYAHLYIASCGVIYVVCPHSILA